MWDPLCQKKLTASLRSKAVLYSLLMSRIEIPEGKEFTAQTLGSHGHIGHFGLPLQYQNDNIRLHTGEYTATLHSNATNKTALLSAKQSSRHLLCRSVLLVSDVPEMAECCCYNSLKHLQIPANVQDTMPWCQQGYTMLQA